MLKNNINKMRSIKWDHIQIIRKVIVINGVPKVVDTFLVFQLYKYTAIHYETETHINFSCLFAFPMRCHQWVFAYIMSECQVLNVNHKNFFNNLKVTHGRSNTIYFYVYIQYMFSAKTVVTRTIMELFTVCCIENNCNLLFNFNAL